MKILLVHGWGYDASVWDDVAVALSSYEVVRLDFGYFGEVSEVPVFDEPIVAVGHSLGVLWLLSQSEFSFKGLVSIAGFDNFAAHVRPAGLKAMQMGIGRRPERVLRDFWAACGGAPDVNVAAAQPERLAAGLEGLARWNGERRLEALLCPVKALASKDDKIVDTEMSRTIWDKYNLVWREGGGHALPMTQAEWCAAQIEDFVTQI